MNFLKKRTRRERYFIYLAGLALTVFIVVQFAVFPLIDKRKYLERNLRKTSKRLEKIQVLKAEYESIQKHADMSKSRLAGRKPDFTLFSFLDKLAGGANIKEHISYMKPSKTRQKNSPYNLSIVEMKLEDIDLKQLTSYLYQVETSPNSVYIRKISIVRTGKTDKKIDAILQVETYET